ncbi:DUF6242 domain-containing protein [Bacteroides sedimenti]|uniref:Exo-alpha-sialidase n=1 Tax=Bacteroides sedimenti TaxID=2136147 RepID=A0ABN6ZBN4_9BACE
MKINILSILVSIFVASLTFTSCLKSDGVSSFETDPTIKSFSFDSIRIDSIKSAVGKDYPFSIDQIGTGDTALIYNTDSLPVNSKISKVKINLTTAGGITYQKNGKDTIWNTTDTLDFTRPVCFTIHAYNSNGTTIKKIYKISINVHKQDPDSLNWGINPYYTGTGIIGKQKSLILNNKIYVFNDDGSAQIKVTSSAMNDGKSWSNLQAIAGINGKADYSSVTSFNNSLYLVSEGNVYSSTNGISWSLVSSLSDKVKTLLVSFDGRLTGIKGVGSETRFCVTTNGQTWENGEVVPAEFPKSNISATSYPLKTNANIHRAILVGDNSALGSADTIATPWSSFDGKDWAALKTDAGYCPKTNNISIIYYNNQFYTFGGSGQNGFKTFYESKDARVWTKVKEKVCFPVSFTGRGDYSYVVDNNNFIWVIWSKTAQTNDEIWKGRINSLGFVTQ